MEGLARFHQDRLMQVQVELKFVRQEMKKLHRAKLRPMRARRQLLRCTSSSTIMNSLDRQIYSDMIFPLIAAADGARARLLPQVCKSWRQCFMLTKCNWHLFAVTQAIKDFGKLARFLHGAHRLKELQLVCQEGAVVESPHSLRTLLSALTMLQGLSLIAPGRAMCGKQEAHHPPRAHDAPIRCHCLTSLEQQALGLTGCWREDACLLASVSMPVLQDWPSREDARSCRQAWLAC